MPPLTRFQRSGLVFDVRDGGPPAGELVVLLHGFPQDSSCWDAVAAGLHAAGLRTLAPDLRGYSPGARPPGRRAYALGHSADDLLALLDAAGAPSAHLVGHDWGGALAWYAAGRDPGRVRTLTSLSTPHPQAMRRAWLSGRQALKSRYMAFFQLPLLPELCLTLSPPFVARSLERTGLPPAYAGHYARRLAERGAARAALGWYRAIPFTLRDRFPPPPSPPLTSGVATTPTSAAPPPRPPPATSPATTAASRSTPATGCPRHGPPRSSGQFWNAWGYANDPRAGGHFRFS
jgi:pimeloyl-ACP methyl ester carboxylesterase